MIRLRRLLAAVTHSGPGCTPPPPRRGDAVEAWLRASRDRHVLPGWTYAYGPGWEPVNDLLNDYRLHADTGTPLDQHVCDGGNCDDCREAAR